MSQWSRIGAVAEVFGVLVVGNLAGRGLLALVAPAGWLDQTFDPALDNAVEVAAVEAVRLAARFGILLLVGFGLLRWRFGLRRRDAGVTLNRHSVADLLGGGIVLFMVSALPWKLVVLLNTITPFGAGLQGWSDVNGAGWSAGVVLLVLARAVVLPPLFEEPLARGYLLTRLGREFGPAGGVVLSSVLFTLGHGHFYRSDPVTFALLVCSLFAAICWAAVTLSTGSIVPAIVAHALANSPEPASVSGMSGVVVVMLAVLALYRSAVGRHVASFVGLWRGTARKLSVAVAVVAVAVIMVAGAWYRPLLPLLAVLSGILVLVDLVARRLAARPAM